MSDVAVLAAAYATGIARNHPFIDGNKPMALLAIERLLDKNGCDLTVDRVEATATVFELAAGNLDEESLARWIRGGMKRRSAR